MNKILAISIASASIAIGAIPAIAEVDSKIHALCLDAKDYAGCVQTQTSLSNQTVAAPIDSKESEPIESTAWQKHLNENPDLKVWVEANPALGKKKKDSWEKKNSYISDSEKNGKESHYCTWNPWDINCKSNPKYGDNESECNALGAEYKWNGNKCRYAGNVNNPQHLSRSCPPGTRQYQKTAFFGLIKGAKLCLSDYEAESLRQAERHRALQNFSDSMRNLSESMKPPRVINCYSNTYGNYTSTSCY